MGYKKHLTKGKWELIFFPKDNQNNLSSHFSIHSDSEYYDDEKIDNKTIAFHVSNVGSKMDDQEFEANAQLIAEAGTVCNECGKTPRELLDLVNELSERVKELLLRDELDEVKNHQTEMKAIETLKKISV